MPRCPVHVRDAHPDDAFALCEIWSGVGRQSDRENAFEGAAASIARLASDPDQRLLVAVMADRPVGAVHLTRTPLSPVQPESSIHVSHLQVLEGNRRHGVGHALLEAAVAWAEEKGTEFIFAAASCNSREANRFMARLGLGAVATVRGASVSALRAKLPVETPVAARVSPRTAPNVGQVLARRRSLRRAQTRVS